MKCFNCGGKSGTTENCIYCECQHLRALLQQWLDNEDPRMETVTALRGPQPDLTQERSEW